MASFMLWSSLTVFFFAWSASAQQCGMATDFRQYSTCMNAAVQAPCSASQAIVQGSPCSQKMTAQCPPGTFLHNNYCVPMSSAVCPPNTVYANGVCQAKPQFTCPVGHTYTNGVCMRIVESTPCVAAAAVQTVQRLMVQPSVVVQPAPTPCSASIQVQPQIQTPCSANIIRSGCPFAQTASIQSPCAAAAALTTSPCAAASTAGYQMASSGVMISPSVIYNSPTECQDNMILFNGTCVDLSVATCPAGSHLVKGRCIRDTVPITEMVSQIDCPEGSILQNGACTRKIDCPFDTIQYGALCVRCPVGEVVRDGKCIEI